uniref:Uncharacterized protein n=1 Tax=Steinernema glaseri TaxID=37863 RepID=A0A1I7YWS8_9BILA
MSNQVRRTDPSPHYKSDACPRARERSSETTLKRPSIEFDDDDVVVPRTKRNSFFSVTPTKAPRMRRLSIPCRVGGLAKEAPGRNLFIYMQNAPSKSE